MKLHSIEIIEERQVSAYFPDGCAFPVQLHFQTDEGEQPVTGVLPGDDFHRSGSTLEFLVQAFDDIGVSERNPLNLPETPGRSGRIPKSFRDI